MKTTDGIAKSPLITAGAQCISSVDRQRDDSGAGGCPLRRQRGRGIILTGEGDKAFCAGAHQKVRGDYGGYSG